MEQEAIYVGVDVAKVQMDVAVRPTDDGWVAANDDAGLRQLVSRLKTLEPQLVVLEASGGLELPLVAALAVEEVPVVVVNPRQVRDFARATGKLAKTDALDASVLAHFGEAVKPPVRPLRDAETQTLNSLVARRHQVMSMLISEKNRLNTAIAIAVRSSIEAHIEWLQRELDDLDTDLRQTLQQSPVWREKDNLLRSVPGVGEQISLTLLVTRQPFLPARCLKVFVTELKLLPHGECYRNQVIASQWVLPRLRRQVDGRRDQWSGTDRGTQGYTQPVQRGVEEGQEPDARRVRSHSWLPQEARGQTSEARR